MEVPTRPQQSHRYSSKALAGLKKALRHWLIVLFLEGSRFSDSCAVVACLIELWGQVEHVSTVWVDP